MYDRPVRLIRPASHGHYRSAPNTMYRCIHGLSLICCCYHLQYSCTIILQPRGTIQKIQIDFSAPVLTRTKRGYTEPDETCDRLGLPFKYGCLHQPLLYCRHKWSISTAAAGVNWHFVWEAKPAPACFFSLRTYAKLSFGYFLLDWQLMKHK